MLKNFPRFWLPLRLRSHLTAQAQDAPDEWCATRTRKTCSPPSKSDKDLAAGNQKKIEKLAEEKSFRTSTLRA